MKNYFFIKVMGKIILTFSIVSMMACSQTPSYTSSSSPPKRWLPDNNTGCLLYNPKPLPNEAITWSGKCLNGYASGTGIVQWYKNGNPTKKYQAILSNGKRIKQKKKSTTSLGDAVFLGALAWLGAGAYVMATSGSTSPSSNSSNSRKSSPSKGWYIIEDERDNSIYRKRVKIRCNRHNASHWITYKPKYKKPYVTGILSSHSSLNSAAREVCNINWITE